MQRKITGRKDRLENFMFIYSVRASTIKFCALAVFVVIFLGVVVGFAANDSVMAAASGEVNYSGIKTNADRVRFIEQFGVMVADEAVDEEKFQMPENFDRVILGYNELQKKQGLDLSKYAKKKVTRYTYRVENYDSEGEVFVNLFIHRGKVVACDICSAMDEGFVAPLTLVERDKLKQ